MWKSFLRKDEGASLVEESLVIGLMAIAATIILTSIASFTAATWREAHDSFKASPSHAAASNPSDGDSGASVGGGTAGSGSPGGAAGSSPGDAPSTPGSGQDGGEEGLGGQNGQFEFDTD